MSAAPDPWAFQRWAFHTRTGNPGRKSVFVSLAVMADKQSGRCEAKQETIAEMVECEPRTVSRHMKTLEEMGLVERRRQHRIDGSRRGDEYLLLAPWVTEWPDGQPAKLSGRDAPTGQFRQDLPDKNNKTNQTKTTGQEQPLKEQPLKNVPEIEFEDWFAHHVKVTGNPSASGHGTQAWKKVRASYSKRRREYPTSDLKLVSIGAVADEYRRLQGYTDAESVLRPMAVPKLLIKGASATKDHDDWDAAGIQARARAAIEEDATHT